MRRDESDAAGVCEGRIGGAGVPDAAGDAPVLDLTGKTVTFDAGETTNVVVKISSTDDKRGRGGKHALTSAATSTRSAP